MMRTRWPGSRCPASRRARSAVIPEMGTAAAWVTREVRWCTGELVFEGDGVFGEGAAPDAEDRVADV